LRNKNIAAAVLEISSSTTAAPDDDDDTDTAAAAATNLQSVYESTHTSWYSQLRTGGFCWSRVWLSVCLVESS